MIICPKCQHENVDTALNCISCGQPLAEKTPTNSPDTNNIPPIMPPVTAILTGNNSAIPHTNPRSPNTKNFAIASLVLGLLIIAVIVIMFPLFSKTHGQRSPTSFCVSNQKLIALAVNIYAQENKENLPPSATTWRSDIGLGGSKFMKNMVCQNESGPISYGFNDSLLGSSLDALPIDVSGILLTADSQVDTMATFSDVTKRHNNGAVASFLDGHVEYLEAATVMTDPTVNIADGAPNTFVLEGANALYNFDGTTLLGSKVTLAAAAGAPVYFAISIGLEYYDTTVQTAVGGKTITSGLLTFAGVEKVTPPATAIGTNKATYYVYAVTMPVGYTKINIIPKGGILAITFE